SDPASSAFFGSDVALWGDVLVVGAYGVNSSRGAAYIFERNAGGTNAWGQVQRMVAPDGSGLIFYGPRVEVGGDVVLVSATGQDSGAGAVYLYERNADGTNAWGLVKKMVASDAASSAYFGQSVAVRGDLVIVGANGAQAAYIFERDEGGTNAWGQIKKLVANQHLSGDAFGIAVGIDGGVAVVGARGLYHGSPYDAGTVHVYERENGDGTNAWGWVTAVQARDATTGDSFGDCLSLDGDTLLVGARAADPSGSSSGAAYLFKRHGIYSNAWGQVNQFVASDAAASAQLGCAVALDGDVAVAGAYGMNGRGAAYIFPPSTNAKAYRNMRTLQPAISETNAVEFGRAVAVSGDLALIGAANDQTHGADAGAAYLFQRNKEGTNVWGLVTTLYASDAAGSALFGQAVALDGDLALIGSPRESSSGSDAGAAYLFRRNQGGTNAWGQINKLMGSDTGASDHFGISVALRGNVALIGAEGARTNQGAAYVFERNAGGTNAWGEVVQLVADDGADSDLFGASVSIAGDLAVAGAVGHDATGSDAGAAYVYERDTAGLTNGWAQLAKLTVAGLSNENHFGTSVAADGDLILVGAPQSDGGTNNTGAAYLFQRVIGGTNAWGLQQTLVADDGADGDLFGSSVSIAGDVALVGAQMNSSTVLHAGAAYVFQRNAGGTNAWGLAQKMTPSTEVVSNFFGAAVSACGNSLLIGAPGIHNGIGRAELYEEFVDLTSGEISILGTNGQPIISGGTPQKSLGNYFTNTSPSAVSTNSFTITNADFTTLYITSVTTSGTEAAYFSLTDIPASLAPNSETNFSVIFTPSGTTRWFNAMFTFTNSSEQLAFEMRVYGQVEEPRPIMGLSPDSLSYTCTYAVVDTLSKTFALTNSGGAAFSFSNEVSFGQAESSWLTITPATGLVEASSAHTITASVATAGLDAGTYWATNTIHSTEATNGPMILSIQVEVGRANQTITFPIISDQKTTNLLQLTATADSGLPVAFSVASGPATLTNQTQVVFNGTGEVAIIAAQTGNTNWNEASAITNTFEVTKAQGTVLLTALQQNYDGHPKSITAASQPAGLSVTVTYNGSATPPTLVGTYAVTGTITDARYEGQQHDILTISKGSQSILFPNPGTQPGMHSIVQLRATAGSGLPVVFRVVSGSATLTGGTNLSFTSGGLIKVGARQNGNTQWNAAPEVVNSFIVQRIPLDFDADGKSDIGCFDAASKAAYFYGGVRGFWSDTFSDANSYPVSGYFDSDNLCDYGTFYPPAGRWEIHQSQGGTYVTYFGYTGTLPITGDFDGDGVTDLGCYDPAGGNWYVYKSSAGYWTTSFGFLGTVPITGDFDGDGIGDFGCYYAPDGGWYIYKSRDGFWENHFGFPGTVPITGDFDGDGMCDFGCYYAPDGGWYIYKSRDGFWENHFGFSGTIPVTGDYDGDGSCDFGCYYPPNGGWYLYNSTSGNTTNHFGYTGTIPFPP
ncbi:MAG: MBG domain-containing protein, partial [Kiritimatiellae bacterium]|nr:MBG domain-containing protein [Kiritimatiellia bacterium]